MVKKVLFFIIMFTMNILNVYADLGGRGRYDSDGPSDFVAVLMGIAAIIVGVFLAPLLFNGDGKEQRKMGCTAILCVLVGIILLASMCSN